MYYKKISDVPSIPKDIKTECLRLGEENIKKNIPLEYWYSRFEYEDESSVSFIEKGTEKDHFKNENTGGVGFYQLDTNVVSSLIDFYKNIDHPISKNRYWYLQVVTGGSYVAPHIDDPGARSDGYFYLIRSGGIDVRTVWYEVKDEFKDRKLTYYAGIPYNKLDIVESHKLEEDSWHWLNFSKIHSVENQQSLRLSIWGRP